MNNALPVFVVQISFAVMILAELVLKLQIAKAETAVLMEHVLLLGKPALGQRVLPTGIVQAGTVRILA